MSTTECPYCDQHVSYWVKLKPAFQLIQQFVVCPHCGKKISSFWIRGALGAGLGGGFLGYHLGRGESLLVHAACVIVIFILSMMISALFINLEQSDSESIDKIRSEMICREMAYSWARILKIIAVTVGLFALLIWLSQPDTV